MLKDNEVKIALKVLAETSQLIAATKSFQKLNRETDKTSKSGSHFNRAAKAMQGRLKGLANAAKIATVAIIAIGAAALGFVAKKLIDAGREAQNFQTRIAAALNTTRDRAKEVLKPLMATALLRNEMGIKAERNRR